ncbi:hypothetical protein B0H34DRAFT_795730 [Crassisporium funariophilum]|nr:hypothetical protein B0H34DRAFT_795730 [Crassisporium funariophilum]
MPVPLRMPYHKAEAKYNVTTEFPSLGLHSAAATGNVGLVEYALDHGQPINSVLDGVLPLHAACAGGNVQVVKVLIDHGADVNAPRLPRKYSNDKNRDSSAPIVGTSGSTPLHFAAANGNTDVVTLLLLHGAHANRPDKHGVTSEMLAQQNGWLECASVIKNWILNKDRDLREREGPETRASSSSGAVTHDYLGSLQPEASTPSSSSRRRLHVKQSIDTALNMLKTPESKTAHSLHTSTPPASPLKPFGEYTFYPVDPSNNSPVDPGSRRPSLPHVLQPPSAESARVRKPSSSLSTSDSPRRPRSAGTGADQSPEQDQVYPVYGRGGSGRKLGSKYSLLNIFKKAQHGEATDSNLNLPETGSMRNSPGASSGVLGSTVTLPLSMASAHSGHASKVDLTESTSVVPTNVPPTSRSGFRFHRGSDASTKGVQSTPQIHTPSTPPLPRKSSGTLRSPSRANVPLAVELHMALAQQQQQQRAQAPTTRTDIPASADGDEDRGKPSSPLARFNATLPHHNRNRSISSVSITLEPNDDEGVYPSATNPDLESGKASPNPRPSILKAHNRTSSSGQGSYSNPRTLRFDSSSSIERKGKDKTVDSPRSGPTPLKSQNSTGSLTKLKIQTNERDVTDTNISSRGRDDLVDDPDGDQEDNYGQPIHSMENGPRDTTAGVPSVLLQRLRGASFASSSESSLSPILTNEIPNVPSSAELNADFPFSINRPPSLDGEEREDDLLPPRGLLAPTSDSRNRGDSLSSDSTSDSRNPQMSSSITSASGTSVTISTPGLNSLLMMPPEGGKSLELESLQEPSFDPDNGLQLSDAVPAFNSSINERRARTPLDINITSISSHAQAEALVQRARQEVLDLASTQDVSPITASTGRTPLSARLAAYGESLALERKLREQKESETYWKDRVHDPMPMQSPNVYGVVMSPVNSGPIQRREGVERQLSLENKSGPSKVKRRAKDPRRPSTADGLYSSKRHDTSFFSESSGTHQLSSSASAANQLQGDGGEYSSTAQDNNDRTSSETHVTPINPDLTQPLSRSRTTDVIPDESLSRISSFDGGADTETDSALTLHRVSTAPLTNAARGKREQVRSAKKLMRMGYPATEQAASRATPATPPPSKRFGAIKSLMQTFKGKA